MNRHSEETKLLALALVLAGNSARSIERRLGLSSKTVGRWCLKEGIPLALGNKGGPVFMRTNQVLPKHSRKTKYGRLSTEDRQILEQGRSQNKSFQKIAAEIGCSASTLSREVSKYSLSNGIYSAEYADLKALEARKRDRPKKLETNVALRSYVVLQLLEKWSPEQISLRLKHDFPDNEDMRVSHETIYQALYVQGKGSLRQELKVESALRRGHAKRVPRSYLPSKRGSKTWVEGAEISLRPQEVEDRAVPGHWEGDLVAGSDCKSCLVTLVERKTRFLLMGKLAARDSENVIDKIRELIGRLPSALAKTLTWDQGTELALAKQFEEVTNIKVFFCDPYSPWQRGTNENTNGLIRQYFPKGTKFTDVSEEEIREVERQLNSRPRKTLDIRTPAEALQEELDAMVI